MNKLIVALLCSLSIFANCEIELQSENLCAELVWLDGPYLNNESSFEVNFYNKQTQKPTSPISEVEFYSWMIMNHGHSHGGPAISWTQVSEGKFLIEDARFFMMHGGFWNIAIELFSNSGVSLEKKLVRVEF